MESIILLFIVFLPIVLGVMQYILSVKLNRNIQVIGIICAIIETILTFLLIVAPFSKLSLKLSFIELTNDGFRAIYSFICSLMWVATLLFSKQYMKEEQNKNRYFLFNLLTYGATLGVFLSSSLLSIFMFFELMSFCAYVLIVHEQTKEATHAAKVYLIITIISGMILLFGLWMINYELKTLNIEEIYTLCCNGINNKVFIGGICLLIGFGAKAGMFPLHIWLPKAHAVAPSPSSALLSGILTKSGVYGIIICVCNIFISNYTFAFILLVLALITMCLGSILALFSIQLKRTLACSSMSQIGYILLALAMMIFLNGNSDVAFEGSFLHMVNHSLIKLVLFICAGIMFMNVKKLDLNDLKGYGKKKIGLMICFLIATLSICGMPFFGGYLSKTLIHEALITYINTNEHYILFKFIEILFLIVGGITIAYMLKLFICIFIEKNDDEELQKKYNSQQKYMNGWTIGALSISMIALLISYFFDKVILTLGASFFNFSSNLSFISYYTLDNLKGILISLIIGILIYIIIVRLCLIKNKKYVDIYPKWLNMEDLIYRPIVFSYKNPSSLNVLSYSLLFVIRGISELFDGVIYFLKKFVFKQSKYKFDSSPLTYRLSLILYKYKKDAQVNYSYKLYEGYIISKEVTDTLNSTFAFDFLMACIGIVVVLILMIV